MSEMGDMGDVALSGRTWVSKHPILDTPLALVNTYNSCTRTTAVQTKLNVGVSVCVCRLVCNNNKRVRKASVMRTLC